MLTKQAMEYLKLGTGGSYSLSRDAISHRIWDTRVFGAAITNYTFFSQPVNSVLLGAALKTLNETNVYDSGKLPNGQTFLINRMGVAFQTNLSGSAASSNVGDMVTAFANILKNSTFEIKLAGREFDFQCQGKQFLPMPIQDVFAGATQRVGDVIGSGWVKLDPTPIFLDQLVSFTVTQTIQNAIPGVQTVLNAASTLLSAYYGEMQVVLDGFLTRAK